MGDNKISETAVEAARDAYHEADVEPMRAAIEAALNHLQDEAVPVACVPDDAAVDELRRFANSNIGSAHGITRKQAREVLVKFANFYLHPQPAELSEVSGTPSSRWMAAGDPDPHSNQYNCERAALALGRLTDDELANEVFIKGDRNLSYAEMVAGELPASAYLLAAKDRIRWLSRALEAALAATGKQQVGEVQGSREQFEAWAKSNNYSSLKWPDGAYAEEAMQLAWKAWQHLASRQAVRIYGCCAQPEGELHTAECPNMRHLASRQPAGQEAFAYTRATSAVDPLPVITPAEYAALREQGMGESYRPLALLDGRDAGAGVE